MDEIWKPAPGWEDRLEVSDHGRVRTIDRLAPSKREKQPSQMRRGAAVSPWVSRNGYLTISTKRDGVRHKSLVHRLVAMAFVPGEFEGATIDHLDADRLNNAASNLEWVTRAENSRRQNADGRGVPKGELHPSAKLANADLPKLFEMRAAGMSLSQIGKAFGVSASLVHKITTGSRRTA